MKMIVAALTASAFLAGAAVPASAETDVTEIAEALAEKLADASIVELVKERRYVPRQIEHDFSKLPVGTDEWWRQRDRERGGRR